MDTPTYGVTFMLIYPAWIKRIPVHFIHEPHLNQLLNPAAHFM